VDLITWLACCCWQLCGAADVDGRRWRRRFGNRRSVVETEELEIGEGEGEALKRTGDWDLVEWPLERMESGRAHCAREVEAGEERRDSDAQ